MERVRIRLLGPLEADVGGRPADLGGPRQRAVLGLLLVARGEVVSVDRLIDDLWRGEPPPRAIGALQAYVSNLRRALEPSRPPRTPAQVLVSAPPGYAVRLAETDVDAWEFESLLARAASAPADAAVTTLRQALGLWRGPALAEYGGESWALPPAARLDELRLVARERLVDAEIRAGRFAEAVVGAQALVGDVPLREESWRLLALGQYADGRQGDALASLRTARELLADELGIDPGPGLLALEQAVLTQSVELPRVGAAPQRRENVAAGESPPVRVDPSPEFVGRNAELATLLDAAEASQDGSLAFGLVAGDAGSGKSALLSQLRRHLASSGWRVAVGRCPESAGGAPAWAWAEALRELAAQCDPGEHAAALAPLLSDAAASSSDAVVGRYHLHRAVQQWLSGLSDRPLGILLDDMHRADAETRSLLTSLLDQGLANRVLIVLAYRAEDNAGLDELRAALAHYAPARVRLGGLGAPEAAALIASVTGTAPDPVVVEALTARTDGNPFYLTESARLLASEGEVVATSQVPEGVADVLRRRFARLPAETVSVLRLASVAGRDVDVALLVRAAEVPEDVVLDALESGLISGLLVEPGPGQVRFAHLLIRETLYGGISRLRRARWHARMADAVAALYPGDLSALAYHSVEAATPASAAVAAERAVAAAALAEGRYAYDAAIGLYRDALRVLDLLPTSPVADRIAVVCKLIGAQLRFGATIDAAVALKEGVELAERSGDDRLLVQVLTAWQVPTPWVTRSYGYTDEQLIATIRRVLDTVSLTSRERCLVLFTLVRETAHAGDDRPERAVTEMIALAREIGEPELIALALSASNVVYLADVRAAEQAAMTRELGDIAREHGLVIFEQLAEIYATQGCGVALDLAGFERHLERARTLAHEYHLGQAIVVVTALSAILAFLHGDLDGAEAHWREAGVIQARIGGTDAENQVLLATFLLAYVRGEAAALVPRMRGSHARGTPLSRDCLALGLVENGDLDEARVFAESLPELPVDYLWLLFMSIRGLVWAAVADAERGARCYQQLLPYRAIVAGSGSTGYVFVPVGIVLGRLARMLGRPEDAQAHFAEARAIAERCGNPYWADLVDADLAAVDA